MASGKSLELAQIKRKPGLAKCICGEVYQDHLRKDGNGVLKKYSDYEKHRPALTALHGIGVGREMRRRLERGN